MWLQQGYNKGPIFALFLTKLIGMKDYRETKRRFAMFGNRVYQVQDQTGLSDAIPSNPLDALVVLEQAGRPSPDFQRVLTVTVRYMLSHSTEYNAPNVAGAHGEGEPITKGDDR